VRRRALSDLPPLLFGLIDCSSSFLISPFLSAMIQISCWAAWRR
jgi:hypothetical protein